MGGEKHEIGSLGKVGHIGGDTAWRPTPVNRRRQYGSAPASIHIQRTDEALDGLYVAENPKPRGKLVALNESGTQRIGEDHPRAKLTDAQVEAMRDDFEAYPVGDPRHLGYRALAKKYGCSKRTARDICNFVKRNQWASRWKRV